MKPYIAQTASNLRLMGRDKSVLIYSALFPMVFFFTFAQIFGASSSSGAMSQVFSRVIIIGVLGSGFFGAGMRTVLDRETNVLRRFKVAPINAGPIIVASMISGWAAFMPTVFLFLLCGKFIYHAPLPEHLLSLFIFVSIGVLAFRAMGMIIASVVNSQQEATILIQLLYLPMLFLSGATFPLEMMPTWVQNIANFLPATYLFLGIKSILLGETAASMANIESALALIMAMGVALFIGVKLFRWEKEEKIAANAKLWIFAVLAPFILAGCYQAYSKQGVTHEKVMNRQAARMRTVLFTNVNIFVGNGEFIQGGSVLMKDGKIAQVYRKPPADTASLNAEILDESGRTLMPGLIDMHVHLGAPGGVFKNPQDYADPKAEIRRLAAYLYSGVTTVRSTGDLLNAALDFRAKSISDENTIAQAYTCGPLFTASGGHPQEMLENFPDFMKQTAKEQFLRQPKTADEARAQVDALKQAGVDCVKGVLEAGNENWGKFNRLDPQIYQAVIAEATKQGLPTATHTGSAADVKLVIEAGSNSIEHGSTVDLIPEESFAAMKARGIMYDPTLSVFEAYSALAQGNTQILDRPLLQQVGPADLIANTKSVFAKPPKEANATRATALFAIPNQNLLHAYQSGVTLITGSDAGNPMVIHGPTVQHELELWVNAKIPAAVALQAATYNAAKALHQENRIGLIKEGREATFLLLDGDPLQDISATEHINAVYLRGEHIDRSDLFDPFKK